MLQVRDRNFSPPLMEEKRVKGWAGWRSEALFRVWESNLRPSQAVYSLVTGHLNKPKPRSFEDHKKRKALQFFSLIIPVFCGNNQALYILYWLHSWLFGPTNISSHTLPSQPFLDIPPPPLSFFLKTFPHFSMVTVWSQWASRSLGWCTYYAWREFLFYRVGRALGSGNTDVD